MVPDDDDEILTFKVDMTQAYRLAVAKMQARIQNSNVPGLLLTDIDVQNIVNDMLASMIEFALISRAIKPVGDNRDEVRAVMLQTVDAVIADYDRISASIRNVKFHDRPAPVN